MHNRRRVVTSWSYLWLILITCSLSPLAAETAATPRTMTTFSYTTNDPQSAFGVPLVQVNLDGGVTATFALDTGTNPSLISDALAKKLGLTPKPFEPKGRPFMLNGKHTQSVIVTHFNIDDLRINTQTLLVVDAKILAFGFQHPVDGVMGLDMMAQFTMLFDFPHHHVVVWYPGGFSRAEIADSAFKDSAPIPLKLVPETALFSVPVELWNGTVVSTIDLTVDTGAGLTSISPQAARRLHLVPVQQYNSSSANGAVRMGKAFVSKLRLGASLSKDQRIAYPSNDNTKFSAGLGMDIFSSHMILMDFPERTLYVITP